MSGGRLGMAKYLLLILPMSFTACSLSPPREPLNELTVPVPQSFRLSNGLNVWLLEQRQVPLVTVTLLLRAGSSSDPRGKEGLAALTADMLDEGAGRRGALEIADEVDFLGADLLIEAQKEHTRLSLEILRRNLDPGLDILADVAFRPTFDPKEWARVKTLALNNLAQRREEPREVARVTAERVFYGDGHPYSHPVSGYESSVGAIELEDVKSCYGVTARPERALILVVGDVTRADLEARLEARFGAWKGGGPAPSPPAPPSPPSGAPRLAVVDKPGAPQTEVRICVPAPQGDSPEVAPIVLANTVFGGTFTSRLVTNLRERNGFTYGASSVLVLRTRPTHLVAGSAVHSDKTGPALVEFCREFRAIETGKLTPDEIKKAHATVRSRLVEALESQDATTDEYLTPAALGLPPESRRDFYRRVEQVSPQEIERQCSKTFRWDRATIVLVGDRKVIESQLSGLTASPPGDPDGKDCGFPQAEVRGREGEPH